MRILHDEADVLKLGMKPVSGWEPTVHIPSFGKVRQFRAHNVFRMTDNLWHAYRYTDSHKAAMMDRDFPQPILPRS